MIKDLIKIKEEHGMRKERGELCDEAYQQQFTATQLLVSAIREQLIENQVDRDAETDWSVESRRYDAFLKTRDEGAAILLSSVGLPETRGSIGTFAYIYAHIDKVVEEVVGLQTARHPDDVDEFETLWLSGYSPASLQSIATIIKEAIPTNKEEFDKFRGPS